MSPSEDRPARLPAAPKGRLFIALWPPPELARALGQRVHEVLGPARALRLVRWRELHLTLSFLGEVERGALPLLADELARGLAGLAAPRLALGEPGCFPLRGPPRVWWLGLVDDPPRLDALHAACVRAAARAGLSPAGEGARESSRSPSPFRPHLTVARTRERAVPDARLEQAFRALRVEGCWTAAEALLVDSRLTGGPERYAVHRRLPLLEGPARAGGLPPGGSPPPE